MTLYIKSEQVDEEVKLISTLEAEKNLGMQDSSATDSDFLELEQAAADQVAKFPIGSRVMHMVRDCQTEDLYVSFGTVQAVAIYLPTR